MKKFLSNTTKFVKIRTIFAFIFLFIAGILCMSQSVNAQSALDSFNPNPNGRIRATLVQPDGKIIIGGNFTTILGASRKYIARLNPDGTLDPTFAPNANNPVTALALQPDGKLIIGGLFTGVSHGSGPFVTRNNIARFNLNTSLDTTFDPNLNNTVWSIAVQPNGKIVAGGMFTTAAPNGGAAVTRNHIARFETDGTLDTTFDPNVNGDINALAIHTDGKIIGGGKFTGVAPNGGTSYNRDNIARFNADGTLDATVNLGIEGYIFAVAIQPDGKFIVGGGFSDILLNGSVAATRNCIARFNTDGTLDTTFCPNVNNYIYSLAIQPDGKILVGGVFSFVAPNGGAAVTRNNIARVNLNGTLDTAFNPNTNSRVSAMAVQTDGKTIIGGNFTNIGGTPRTRLARIDTSGALDPNFYAEVNVAPASIAVQSDGRVLISGAFTVVNAQTRNYITRLNRSGSLDSSFNANANGAVRSLMVQPDGKILVGGNFTQIGGQVRSYFARLTNNTAALSNLEVYPTVVLLTRDETAVQFARVIIEQSLDNGTTWTTLGAAINYMNGANNYDRNDTGIDPYMPTSLGYVLRRQNIPTGQNVLIRARGYYRAGDKNGSEIVEDKVQNVFLPTPTAGKVSINGQVMTYAYAGLRNAPVKLELANGDVVIKRTSAFGYFEFDEIDTGQTVTISVMSNNYGFSPQTINVTDNVTDLVITEN